MNVLLFKGKKLIKEDKLEEATPVSFYKADSGKLHEESRDIAKYWQDKYRVRLALLGLKNQTCEDPYMSLRTIAYDGATYKQQLIELLKKPNNKSASNRIRPDIQTPYPVVTIVLYFGSKRWKAPKSLMKTLKIPLELRPFVNDYRINLFEISFLTDEQIRMFKSDFRIVADYFAHRRKDKKYIAGKQTIRHVNEVLQMLRIVADDQRFDPVNDFICIKKRRTSNHG